MLKTFILTFSLVLVACATAGKINKVQLGMTPDEVTKAMGKPDRAEIKENKRLFEYQLSESSDDAVYGIRTNYWVVFVNDKVIKYGRAPNNNDSELNARRQAASQNSQQMQQGSKRMGAGMAHMPTDENGNSIKQDSHKRTCRSQTNVFGQTDTTCENSQY